MTGGDPRAELKRFGASGRPIVIGPWLSEVGFELLYWIPFLRWAISAGHLSPDRLWVLSRGGCRSWYADITANYIELYDAHSPTEIIKLNRARTAEQTAQGPRIGLKRGQQTVKQFLYSQVEQRLVAEAAKTVGLYDPLVLHPSMMYRAFHPAWRRTSHDLFGHWDHLTRGGRLTPPSAISVALPPQYVAVKFYASEANPDQPLRRLQMQQLVQAITRVSDVVLLHTGTQFDEHGEFPIADHPRVHRVRFEPARNLDLQTAIIARSSGFVGTYGGFAYLAPFLGIATVGVYGAQNFRTDHLRLMTDVAHRRLHSHFCVTDIVNAAHALKRERRHWMAHAA